MYHTGGNLQNHSGNVPNYRKFVSSTGPIKRCAVHRSDSVKHNTEQCTQFKRLSQPERLAVLKEAGACFRCLSYHSRGQCRMKDPCARCNKKGHHTLLCRTDLTVSSGNDSVTPAPPIVTTTSSHARIGRSV